MPSTSSGDQPVILLVEDQDDNYELYSELIALAGYRVVGVGDGLEAVEYAMRLLPDLILMDLGLPRIDGCEATRRLKRDERTRHIPVVALTGFVQPHQEDRAREAGCDAFLRKPCRGEQLLEVIERLLAAARPTILLVEDDDEIRSALAKVLAEEGFGVAVAGNGQEALDYLRAHAPPRLILLDLMMPVMNGWQFRAAQCSDPGLAAIPVIVLTAVREAPAEAGSLGVSDVIAKPLDVPVLLNAIEPYVS